MKTTLSWLKEYVDLKGISEEEIIYKITMAGLEVVGVHRFAGERVFEFEVTSNRPDWLSIYGIARELSCIFKRKLRKISAPPLLKRQDIPIIIEDENACPLYTARIFEGIRVSASEGEITKRILPCGINSINNVVDITNFVLLELGQPLHAFDLDKLRLPLYVRRAQDGEKIVTLDGRERILNREVLVIADKNGPVALAGIMGSQHTQVDFSTKRILLESALFNPAAIRNGTRILGLSTESSYRFERSPDPLGVDFASRRAGDLLVRYSQAVFKSSKNVGRVSFRKRRIKLYSENIKRMLSQEILAGQTKSILERLGFRVKKDRKFFVVEAPSWRQDVKIEEDLVEEIARIWGYERIREETPPLSAPYKEKSLYIFKGRLKEILSHRGLYEVVSFSLASKDLSQKLSLKGDSISLKNPLSQNYTTLRMTLLAGLLEIARTNLYRSNRSLRFFEIGEIYFLDKGVKEFPCLGIFLGGQKSIHWSRKEEVFDFFDLKGLVESLLVKLGMKNIEEDSFSVGFLEGSLKISSQGEELGFLGKIKDDILKEFDIDFPSFYAQIYVDALYKNSFPPFELKMPARFPESWRDLSILLDKSIPFSQVEECIRNTDHKGLLKEFLLLEVYEGKGLPPCKKSLLLRFIFQSQERTLKAQEVEALIREIGKNFQEKLRANLR